MENQEEAIEIARQAPLVQSEGTRMFVDQLIRLDERTPEHKLVKESFMLGIRGDLRKQTTVVAIHKPNATCLFRQARQHTFQFYFQAMMTKHDGVGNNRDAWYACNRAIVDVLFSHGFIENRGFSGVILASTPFHIPSQSPMDEEGLRHVVVCHVLLGKMEQISLPCNRSHPSTPEFDSGVDSLSSPKFHFVWATHMNTHILPQHVISFRFPSTSIPIPSPRNPSQTLLKFNFTTFFSELSKVVSQETMNSIQHAYREYAKGKKSCKELMDFVKSSAPRDEILQMEQEQLLKLRLKFMELIQP